MKQYKTTRESVIVTAGVLEGILEMAVAGVPREVCGLLLGGADGHVEGWLPLDNTAGRMDSYRIDPRDYRRAERSLDGTNHHIVGVFHSHPGGTSRPSVKDQRLARALEGAFGCWLYLICGLKEGGGPRARLWRLSRGALRELSMAIAPDAGGNLPSPAS